jgi:hypothetical protein
LAPYTSKPATDGQIFFVFVLASQRARRSSATDLPPGFGVVEGGVLPYRPEALARKKENLEQWMARDPEIKCYMLGIPRATYQGHPFQIVQTPQHILMAYEFANASRIVYMNKTEDSPSNFWMGWSRGRWEGETLVIDVTGRNAQLLENICVEFAEELLYGHLRKQTNR